jgi:hypothetical protein
MSSGWSKERGVGKQAPVAKVRETYLRAGKKQLDDRVEAIEKQSAAMLSFPNDAPCTST